MKKMLLIGGPLLFLIIFSHVLFDIIFDKGPVFPKKPVGVFIEEPSMQNLFLKWSIPELCEINEGEFQKEGDEGIEDGWFGLTATCVQGEDRVDCHDDLTGRASEMERGVNYRLQVYHAKCKSSARYVSEVITFYSE